jgi:RND superfamily putative drug exporter
MAASATLLPALIKVLGHRAYARSRLFTVSSLIARSWRGRRPGSTNPLAAPRPDFWRRWTDRVMARPVLFAAVSAAVLLTLAVPALDMKSGAGALRQFPPDNETRVGFEAAATVTSPGESSPLRLVVPSDGVARAQEALRSEPLVASVDRPVPSRDGKSVLVSATLAVDGESDAAKGVVGSLRAGLPEASVGGISAAQKDVAELISGSMWKILLFVLGLSSLVLLVLLRSVVLPLKAVLMNLLSVGAAYGVLVIVFQYGWLDGFLGFESTGYLDTLSPPLVLAVVFGLSMDYEVFLLSRIKERYDATGDTKRAVAEGLAASARTITSAALIMTAVFAVFVLTGVPSIKQIGLGTAVAIALDATLVRLILVPAAMELMGKWNWYLPKWLDRILPDTSFEDLKVSSGRGDPSAPAPSGTPVGAGVP